MIEIAVQIFLIYLAIGLLFSIAFSWKGAAKIDDGAKEVPWSFKFLIIPGAMALWPVLLIKWLRS